MASRTALLWILIIPPLLFLLVFYFQPLLRILLLSYHADPVIVSGGRSILAGDIYFQVVWFTFWQAALSTLLTFFLALPGAYIYAHYQFPGKKFLRTVSTIPFVLPTVVTASAFRSLLGSNGLINTTLVDLFGLNHPPIQIEQTVFFFLLAHVFYNYTLVLRIVGEFWGRIDSRITEAAALLGATPLQTFLRISLPLLSPALASSALLVFIFCFTSFGIILLLGGPGHATIEVEIYRQTVHLFNLPVAASLSLLQIFINFIMIWIYARIGRDASLSFFVDTLPRQSRLVKGIGQRILLSINLIVISLLLATPLLALVISSFSGQEGVTFAYYEALFTKHTDSVFPLPAGLAISNSMIFAIIAAFLALILGISASSALATKNLRFRVSLEAIILLPLATSAVTMGFGFIVSLNRPPFDLRDSLALIPLAHTLVAFPFVVRCILPGLRSIPNSLREAASMLGASPGRTWYRIDLPLTAKAIAVAAVFAFSISMGEFGATSFIARPYTPTMPIAIFRFLSQPGDLNYGQAMAMSCILMLVTFLAFLVLEKFSQPKI